MSEKTEIYIGENLNRALHGDILILDGRERANPAAVRNVVKGMYRITRTDGTAPGGVDYYGFPIDDNE